MFAPLRHIAITGASSGIGAALARYYAEPGLTLSLLGRDSARLKAVAATCQEGGALVFPHIGDVTNEAAMADWITESWNQTPIDLLVANAGTGGRGALRRQVGEKAAETTALFATNMNGVANVVAPALPRMVARRSGQIAIISSMAGLFGMPQAPGYSASKAAVATYGEALRRQTARTGVQVAVIYPGFVDTPMSQSLPINRPFLWDADRAASHIAARLAQGKGQIMFPWQMAVMARLARLLPYRLLDTILTRTWRKPA